MKTGFALRGMFGDAPAQGVVAVPGGPLRGFGADQAVVAVVLVAGDDLADTFPRCSSIKLPHGRG
ncbi:hypothetical protein [Methylomonas montana]|uniref:hypothetical protein n=1 Tax=Methylomonas montana TaxID=3058963 RepID=UPI00387E8FDE